MKKALKKSVQDKSEDYLKLFFKYFIEYLLILATLTSVFVIPHMIITGSEFLISWEWFHRDLLIWILWYFSPLLTIGVLFLMRYKKKHRENIKNKFLDISNYSPVFHRIIFFISMSIIFGGFGQTAGGCIWQIPVILAGVEGYYWRRFMPPLFPEFFNNQLTLLFVYLTITIAYMAFLYNYFVDVVVTSNLNKPKGKIKKFNK